MSSSSAAGSVTAPSAGAYTTPTKRAAFALSAEAGPSRARPAGASPAYSSRRHSLYGVEDRVVIDPGSRVWRIGFSGETDPRAVFLATDTSDPTNATEAWDLDLEKMEGVYGSRNEGDRLVGVRILKKLREAYVKHLLTDAKARKVIILENTFLPMYVKEHIARALFDNLQVPSVSFTSSSLLALAACGRITGLVVDVGWLESRVTPVYHSRPLYTLSRTTPLAGRKLHRHLRNLLHRHAIYIPPPQSLTTSHRRSRIRGMPISLLTDEFVEKVLTEGCFVSPTALEGEAVDERLDVDEPTDPDTDVASDEEKERKRIADDAERRYAPSSTAKDMSFRISSATKAGPGGPNVVGRGTVIVPGWIRARAAEVLFVDDDENEEESVPRAMLDCLLKLPIDLRQDMISSILVIGGTPSLPGFISRLRHSLFQHLSPTHPTSTSTASHTPPMGINTPSVPSGSEQRSPLNTPEGRKEEAASWRNRNLEPYHALYGLRRKLGIINDPAPLDHPISGTSAIAKAGAGAGAGPGPRSSASGGSSSGGEAPRWTPPMMAWVGGSLAGSLKLSSPEITREAWDTSIQLSLSLGQVYREELDAAEVELSASIGVDVESLRVGEAVFDGASLGRKRGWKEGGGVGDWSRVLRAN